MNREAFGGHYVSADLGIDVPRCRTSVPDRIGAMVAILKLELRLLVGSEQSCPAGLGVKKSMWHLALELNLKEAALVNWHVLLVRLEGVH